MAQEERVVVARARKIQRFLSQPFQVPRPSPVPPASTSPSRTVSPVSTRFWMVSLTMFQRTLSTWLVTSMRLCRRPRHKLSKLTNLKYDDYFSEHTSYHTKSPNSQLLCFSLIYLFHLC